MEIQILTKTSAWSVQKLPRPLYFLRAWCVLELEPNPNRERASWNRMSVLDESVVPEGTFDAWLDTCWSTRRGQLTARNIIYEAGISCYPWANEKIKENHFVSVVTSHCPDFVDIALCYFTTFYTLIETLHLFGTPDSFVRPNCLAKIG